LGQTASLFMLAMRGGLSLGSLVTGLSIELLGVRQALLINGALAVILNLAIGRAWARAPLPTDDVSAGSRASTARRTAAPAV
ncbi:MAG: hypothetical protein ACMG6S_14405, partial [Byssovorax sp.]